MGRYLITGATRGIGRAVVDLLAGHGDSGPEVDGSGADAPGVRAPGVRTSGLGGSGVQASGVGASDVDGSGVDAFNVEDPGADTADVGGQGAGRIGGHELIALGRRSTALRELPVAQRVVADLSEPAGLEAALPAFDWLDGVVHCAGVALRGGLQSSSVAEWQRQMAVNVIAPAELTRLLLPALRAGRGTVVFVNSGQGRTAAADSTIYASTKFALRALADSLRAGEPLLRVSSVFPGRVATDMQRALREQEGGPYEPSSYLQPSTVAAAIVSALTAPPDAVVADITLRPAHL